MSYTVELFNKTSLEKIKDIEVVSEPEIYEEINGAFTLNFDAHYTAKNDLTNDVLIKVDEQYFKIAKVTKRRDDSISLSVQCEHISYELIVDFEIDVDMEFESNAQTMLNECLRGTRFTLASSIATNVMYYRTRTLNIRKRLFEIANLFGGELIFDNFEIHLVAQRGTDKGLDITLGVNLIGVTEEKDYVEGTTAYELDLVDLSEVTGYELDFTRAELGDTVTIIDNVLAINSNERIIAIRYNPFKRALPSVTVGDYIRDMTTYIKDIKEDEEEEETDIKDLFRQFKIGGIDMIKHASDATDDVRKYFSNKYELGVEASAKYNTLKSELVGIVAEAAVGNKFLSVVQTKVNDDGLLVTTITPITSENELSTVKINDLENITLVLSDNPLSHYKENPLQAKSADISAIGVCITFDDDVNVFLERFDVGGISLLDLENLNADERVGLFIENNGYAPFASAEVELEQQLRGLVVVPTDDYMDWYLTLLHSVRIQLITEGEPIDPEDNTWDYEMYELPLANYADFELPTWNDEDTEDHVVVVISSEPFEKIMDGTATEDVYYKSFGAKFTKDGKIEEAGGAIDYFDEFRVGDVDMLPIASNEYTSVSDAYNNNPPNPIIASAIYEAEEGSLTGLFATPKAEYADKVFLFLDYYEELDGDWNMYDDSYETNVNEYELHTAPFPGPVDNLRTISVTLGLFEKHPRDLDVGESIEDILIAAFGIQLKAIGAGESSEDETYLEYGSAYLADEMVIYFDKGPYGDVASVTTGITVERQNAPMQLNVSTMSSGIYSHVTITTELIEEDGKYVGIVAYAYMGNTEAGRALSDVSTFDDDYGYVDIKVNFHAVCKKNRRIVNVEN